MKRPDLFPYRVGFPVSPSEPIVDWTEAHLARLRERGFNTLQLNIAWGSRPADEPLNLEDVVDPTAIPEEWRQTLPLRSKPDADAIARRRARLRERITLGRRMGFRTVFHFGAPYNQHAKHGDTPPNCLMDERVRAMSAAYLRELARQFPGIDDLLVYTYDQDAWLCSEFGACPRCAGRPLDGRVADFVNFLARVWRELATADARLWWEPWELSAGQTLRAVARLDAAVVGLALHSNVAEVMATRPVDMWLRNTLRAARARGLPVWVEHFLGGPTEEVQPWTHLAWPTVLWRGLRAIAELKPDGLKEYYGLVAHRDDVNLRATALFLTEPDLSEQEMLARLAAGAGAAEAELVSFWRLLGEAMDLFPWHASWWIRNMGFGRPGHAFTGAWIRGKQAHTPSWESSRRGVFMKTDNAPDDPWLLEEVQLHCELCAERLEAALALGPRLLEKLPPEMRPAQEKSLEETALWRNRARTYAYHLRATNLTTVLRTAFAAGRAAPAHVVEELRAVLAADAEVHPERESCLEARSLLEGDAAAFVEMYFRTDAPPRMTHGPFAVTSR